VGLAESHFPVVRMDAFQQFVGVLGNRDRGIAAQTGGARRQVDDTSRTVVFPDTKARSVFSEVEDFLIDG
jgi:hypothetical protein